MSRRGTVPGWTESESHQSGVWSARGSDSTVVSGSVNMNSLARTFNCTPGEAVSVRPDPAGED